MDTKAHNTVYKIDLPGKISNVLNDMEYTIF